MKIAYLILAHKDPDHLARLAERLSKTGDSFIYIDKKSNIKEFEGKLCAVEGVYLERDRISVAWGGWSMVKAYMQLLQKVLESPKKYSRIVLMTGQDYPLMSDSQILQAFEENPTVEYVMAYKVMTSRLLSDRNKIQKKWFFDFPLKNIFLTKVYRRIMYYCVTRPFRYNIKSVKLNGKEVDFYFGQKLSAFTRECAELILKTYLEDKKFNKIMRRVYAPDELYWQTIVFNSSFRENTIQHGEEHEVTDHFGFAPLHYHNYDEQVIVYKEDDFEELKHSGYMFFKKAQTGISDKLLDKIDEWRNEKENISRFK